MISAEFIKIKRTTFFGYYIGSSIVIIGLFVLYNCLYMWKSVEDRLLLLFEIYGCLMPLIHGITVFYFINLEEQIYNLYELLSVKNRAKLFGTLFNMIWVLENVRMVVVFSVVGLFIQTAEAGMAIILFCVGEVIVSVFSILFHLWLNLKFGVGLSLFFAMLELMQSVMYSNIHIIGIWRFFPFAWIMEWKETTVSRTLSEEWTFWAGCCLIIALFGMLETKWFMKWEGRSK